MADELVVPEDLQLEYRRLKSVRYAMGSISPSVTSADEIIALIERLSRSEQETATLREALSAAQNKIEKLTRSVSDEEIAEHEGGYDGIERLYTRKSVNAILASRSHDQPATPEEKPQLSACEVELGRIALAIQECTTIEELRQKIYGGKEHEQLDA